MTGFEAGHKGVLSWDYGCSVSAAQQRTGAYSFLCGSSNKAYQLLPGAVSELYLRFGYYRTGHGFYMSVLCEMHDSADGGLWVLDWDKNTNKPQLRVGTRDSAIVATGITSVANDEWHCYEVYAIIDDVVGVFQLKIDGVLDIDYAGDTKPGATTDQSIFWIGTDANDRNSSG